MRSKVNSLQKRGAFKQKAADKGWSMVNLAFRWKITPEYLSRITNNPERDQWWNDALDGLPVMTRVEQRRLDKERKLARPSIKRTSPPLSNASGLRYHEDLTPGTIVVLTESASQWPEKTQGEVKQCEKTEKGERYLIEFNGCQDWYEPDDIDRMMVSTGRVNGG